MIRIHHSRRNCKVPMCLFCIFMLTGCGSAEKRIYQTSENVALDGYDVVAYFTEGRAVPGSYQFRFEWQNTVWQFASLDNLKKFEENPEAYAPQYGGYCAFAMANGRFFSTDPHAFDVSNGKLYLNYSKRVQEKWRRDQKKMIQDADVAWRKKQSDFR